MRTLRELQAECARFKLIVPADSCASKAAWIAALRQYYWDRKHSGRPLPSQVQPMLLDDWRRLDVRKAHEIENDQQKWIVQPKLDGVRAILHIEEDSIRVTGRSVSDVTYRLTEHQENLPQLKHGIAALRGTVLDGELVCPVARVDTGTTLSETGLQAAVAILATDPENAARIQQTNGALLRLHVFDILSYLGKDVTRLPLRDRLDLAMEAVAEVENDHICLVPSYVTSKLEVHNRVISDGGEGTVWKQTDQPYEPGKRVRHWIKRKRSLEVEAFVTGFKPGRSDGGNSHLIGALEFSVHTDEGTTRPIAWVSGLTDADRIAMTCKADGQVSLVPAFYGRRAMIAGQDESARSKRIRHARISRWLDR